MTDNQEQQQITDVSIYIAALQTTFRPAPDARHTTHWFSTDEVHSAIKNLDPSASITKDQLFQAMTAAGFRFQNRPGATGCDFRWMLLARDTK